MRFSFSVSSRVFFSSVRALFREFTFTSESILISVQFFVCGRVYRDELIYSRRERRLLNMIIIIKAVNLVVPSKNPTLCLNGVEGWQWVSVDNAQRGFNPPEGSTKLRRRQTSGWH